MNTVYSQHNFQEKRNTTRGFTLVELMVSLSIFSIVMVISVGTLLIMIDINAKAQALYASNSNLSFALDSMTREMRTGYHYYCTTSNGSDTQSMPVEYTDSQAKTGLQIKDCNTTTDVTTGNFLAFTREKDGKRVGYRLYKNAIQQNFNNGGWQNITSDDVKIDQFELVVSGSSPYYSNGDHVQPMIDLFILGHIDNGLTDSTNFSIQTHIVERRLDII